MQWPGVVPGDVALTSTNIVGAAVRGAVGDGDEVVDMLMFACNEAEPDSPN